MSISTDPNRRPAPVHPGEFLREDYLPDLGLTVEEFAQALGTSPTELAEVIAEKRHLTSDLAYRLSLYFGTSPEFWMNLQSHYELNTIFHSSNLEQMKSQVQSRVAA